MPQPVSMLSSMPALGAFFDQPHSDDLEIMEINELHGFLTALALSPEPIDPYGRDAMIFDLESGNPFSSAKEKQKILAEIDQLEASINRQLSDEHSDIEMPCELKLTKADDCPLKLWAEGFMVGHTITQSMMEDEDPTVMEDMMQLTLPMVMASGWFDPGTGKDLGDDDPDFSDEISTDDVEKEIGEIKSDPKLVADMCRQIPDALSKLYLLIKLGGADA